MCLLNTLWNKMFLNAYVCSIGWIFIRFHHYWTNSLLLDMEDMSDSFAIMMWWASSYTNFYVSPWDKVLELLLPLQTKDVQPLILEVCLLPLKVCGFFFSALPHILSPSSSFNYGENILYYTVAITWVTRIL